MSEISDEFKVVVVQAIRLVLDGYLYSGSQWCMGEVHLPPASMVVSLNLDTKYNKVNFY